MLPLAAAPATAGAADGPQLPAGAWILVDGGDDQVLAAQRPNEERAIASTTKLMTAYAARRDLPLGKTVVAPAYTPSVAESLLGLEAGERIKVRDLLYGLLLVSGNDAAEALAQDSAGTEAAFVREMNRAAQQLGLEHTSYANPIGLDEVGNYSSAHDLVELAMRLRSDPFFRRVFDTAQTVIRSGAHPRSIVNRNTLVRTLPWVNGVKTGYTLDAGNVLVGAANGPGGVRVISVVLGEPSEATRDQDTLALLRWGLGRFHRVRVLDPRRMLAQADIKYRDSTARLVARRSAVLTIRDGEHIRRRVNAPDEVEGPLAAGVRVGTVTVVLDGRSTRRVALVTAEEVPGAGPVRVLLSWLGVPLTLILVLAILVAAVLALLRLSVRIRIVR